MLSWPPSGMYMHTRIIDVTVLLYIEPCMHISIYIASSSTLHALCATVIEILHGGSLGTIRLSYIHSTTNTPLQSASLCKSGVPAQKESRQRSLAWMHGKKKSPYIYPNEHSYMQSCLLYTSPSPRDATLSRMPSSA